MKRWEEVVEAAEAVWKWNDEQDDCAYCVVGDFEDGHKEFCLYLALGKALDKLETNE